ncbi:MAG: phytanoyl-CoA dioxygenase family protein [Kofleriaceae bacterium]|nr:phytanoyl-CoA dioxygenase family protein [Kofleriaceae bacterium]
MHARQRLPARARRQPPLGARRREPGAAAGLGRGRAPRRARRAPRRRGRDRGRARAREPGDVSLHHCLTFHGSRPNTSARPRKTLVLRLFDGACRLVPDRLPSPEAVAHFPTDADGHLDAAAFPVLWSAGAG